MRAVRGGSQALRVQQARSGTARWATDHVATEEPMEIRVRRAEWPEPERIAVTMRTPGHDFELAAGFLFTEGVLHYRDEVLGITYCIDPSLDRAQEYNVVNVVLAPGVPLNLEALRRNVYTTSSCGVCGKGSLEALELRGVSPLVPDGIVVEGDRIARLGESLRASQRLFDRTGGLHAAALFDLSGRLLALREDVGRHNAVDKLLGRAFLQGELPLDRAILMVSGRVGFEIVQKAASARIPLLVAVSAPSSLALDAARTFGITLVGFARGDRFNVYTRHERIELGVSRVASDR